MYRLDRSPTRSAHEAGLRDARSELALLLWERDRQIADMKARIDFLELDRARMDRHYRRECDALCWQIDGMAKVRFESVPGSSGPIRQWLGSQGQKDGMQAN